MDVLKNSNLLVIGPAALGSAKCSQKLKNLPGALTEIISVGGFSIAEFEEATNIYNMQGPQMGKQRSGRFELSTLRNMFV